ncbi:phospholipid methyltransferase [Exidia glandulosa HHB12029]|uniref:Phosphatidyl-N-methylethanolamine N-methyltransferase n=1 Tax=Exidia glandulosa HHB12029 TaxID=1314781 RepID=A0A165E542_EXIGL|nr:phospholipid methyltransferase [Exidia glandulosa HHB12029]
MTTFTFSDLVDINQISFWLSLASITFNPTFWNIVARNEYHNHTITRIFGSARTGTYALALTIFVLGLVRDSLYTKALLDQPTVPLLPRELAIPVPAVLFLIGQTLVVTSTWALGITGTFLGDYFGILLDSKVEGFPFNVVNDPMYTGSTLCFIAGALWYERPAGLLISLYVHIAYRIALKYEGPFTDAIYRNRATATKSYSDAAKKEL